MITVEKHLAVMDSGFTTNTYIVTDNETGDTAVVDPSLPEESLMEKLNGKNVKYILLTHGHFDHMCGAKMVQDNTGARSLFIQKTKKCFMMWIKTSLQ
ncbi:MAG: MBL fold metallo-hydrolase [Clostridia bacterium]|nr:MBL fold metallo-hydrolase [Clostridia bacterium]